MLSRICRSRWYFNPLPPHGGRLMLSRICRSRWYFNPLPPHGGRLILISNTILYLLFQSTPSARRETRFLPRLYQMANISIHSLRTEGDPSAMDMFADMLNFNPLPPHGGRRETPRRCCASARFQSTPSARRETADIRLYRDYINISIHSLRTEGDEITHGGEINKIISIHSLRTEGDDIFPRVEYIHAIFQSTPSARRETCRAG